MLCFADLICDGGPMSNPKRAALYVRVSTDKQCVENQIRDLRLVAERRGWQVVEIYRDEGISGAKRRDQRPGLDAMLKDASRRKFDVVMVWALDRLGRSRPRATLPPRQALCASALAAPMPTPRRSRRRAVNWPRGRACSGPPSSWGSAPGRCIAYAGRCRPRPGSSRECYPARREEGGL